MHSVTAVIPAYNEATRLSAVLTVLQQASLVDTILVVDDGSTDETSAVAERHGVRVLRLPENRGKGAALRTGAVAATTDLLLFLDADLRGLTPEQVDDLVRPAVLNRADMTIGIFRGGRAATDLAQFLTPNISGQRCLSREFFLSVPLVEQCRSGVEVAMTAHARACKLLMHIVPLDGATHTMKEEKMGMLRGFFARWRMYADILITLARYQCATRLPGRAPVRNE